MSLSWRALTAVQRIRVALAGDRRGATAMAFAISASALLGFVALGTEVGNWYTVRSSVQSAADAAAVAGAVASSTGGDAAAAAAAVASKDGYTASVTVNHPPSTGSYTNSTTYPTATEVVISTTASPILASLFTDSGPTISARAVGVVTDESASNADVACVFSTSLDLNISQTQTASGCFFASNSQQETAVNIFGGATVSADGISSVGNCTGCASATLIRPNAAYQPATSNPYAAIDTAMAAGLATSTSSYCCIGSCVAAPTNRLIPGEGISGDSTYPLKTGAPFYAYCSTVTISSGTWTLAPGTYHFVDASLIISGGTVQCKQNGVSTGGNCVNGTHGETFIFTGNGTAPTLEIDSAATVTLAAQKTINSAYSSTYGTALNGVLFYMDKRLSGTVNISGKTTTTATVLSGGMYFPNATVSYGANGGASSTSCAILVGNNISLTNVASKFRQSGCSTLSTPRPKIQAAKVVE